MKICKLCARHMTSKGYCQVHYSMMRKRRINEEHKELTKKVVLLEAKLKCALIEIEMLKERL